jgi:putative DNA primase/helicase
VTARSYFVDRVDAIAASGLKVQVPRIRERDENALREDLSSAACFEKFDARADGFTVADPPMTTVKTLLARRGRLRFPILAGVVNVPTMRADGTILDAPGYDTMTGLLYDPLGVTFPSLPNRPTRGDAEKALAQLNDVIKDFPFVEPMHRSVALSTILTGCCRRSLPAAPLHAFSAPVLGSGKSKLVDIASVISTGQEAAVTAQGANDEEFEKRLVSHLLAGAPIVALDNCSRPLGGDLLNQMLTQQRASTRILGKSEAPSVSTNALMTATGNNLIISGDMVRRCIIALLNPNVERPELRIFDREPVAYAKENRPALVAAVLTVLRAYHVAGRPDRPSPLGSFEEWSDLVRGSLIWLGCADPVETISKIREADPVMAQIRTVMSAWRETIGRENTTVSRVIKTAVEQRRAETLDGRLEFVNEDLREALLSVAGRGGVITNLALGKWLSAHKDRIVGGVRFAQFGEREGVAVWGIRDA